MKTTYHFILRPSIVDAPAVIEALLAGGVDVNARFYSDYGDTPFFLAVNFDQNLAVIEALLAGGANPNMPCPEHGDWTPLHWAAANYRTAIAPLPSAGARADAQDEDGWTPLHFAAEARHIGSADTSLSLISACTDVNVRNRDGDTLLHLVAANSANATVIKALLSAGANPAIKSMRGDTPLDNARVNESLNTTETASVLSTFLTARLTGDGA